MNNSNKIIIEKIKGSENEYIINDSLDKYRFQSVISYQVVGDQLIITMLYKWDGNLK
jgi:hypothetical protein